MKLPFTEPTRLEQFLIRLESSFPAIFMIFDIAERSCVFISGSVTSNLGYSRDEVYAMGANVVEILMHPEDALRFERHIQHVLALADGDLAQFEHRMRDRDGEWHWFRNRDTVFERDEAGRPTRIVATAVPILLDRLPQEADEWPRAMVKSSGDTVYSYDESEREQSEQALQASEAKLKKGIEVAALALAEVNYETGTIHMSQAAAQMYGLGESEVTVLRDVAHSIFHPLDQAELETKIAAALDPAGTGRFSMEHRIVLADGSSRWLRVRKQVQFDGHGAARRPVRAMLAALDITEEKRSEQALAQAIEDWKLFAYGASHDLSAPLRQISIHSQLLLKQHGAQLDADAIRMLERNIESTKQMSQLISDLLAFVEASQSGEYLVTTPVETAFVVGKVCHILDGSIQEANASVTCEPLPSVLVNPVLLEALFQNLLTNSLKYRKDGIASEIRISAAPHEGHWQFSIRDNGIGIPAEFQAQVFRLFKRLHANEGTSSGSGVGLALCQKIVERHGGRIWIESDGNQGTTVHFTLSRLEARGTGPAT